jgi:hypothetical protein
MPAPNPPQAKDRSYLKPGLPVFSFIYALYCDPEYSEAHSALFFEALRNDRHYLEYLNAYRRDPTRPFPRAILDLSEDVPHHGNKDQVTQRYLPTRAQAWDVMPYLVRELTGTAPPANEVAAEPAPGDAVDPSPAQPNADRPLISCLAAIFLNKDPLFRKNVNSFLAGFDIAPNAQRVLTTFSQTPEGTNLTEGQMLALTPHLVEEMILWPACW